MQYVSFNNSLLKIKTDLDVSYGGLANLIDINRTQLYKACHFKNVNLKTVQRIAYGLDLIPVVLHRKEDDSIMNLNKKTFLYGGKIKNYFGKAIAKRRINIHMSQAELQALIDAKSDMQISFWETGRRSPSIKSLELVCENLNLIPEYLVPKKIKK